ncbi:MAG: type II 3-dehydroquinate dehydratase [Deltaproteobacteria bacterium]|nr:type II 3-dehydroquinate dehydratase [Deltaproteobacteria bacterium]
MSSLRPRVLVLHGPNLDRLGTREPAIYGTMTLVALNERLQQRATAWNMALTLCQSNSEAEILDRIAGAPSKYDVAMINPGGLTHTSVALRDAICASPLPFIEVHMSNIAAREPFRRHSYIAPVVAGSVVGLGVISYEVALCAARQIWDNRHVA